MVDISTYTIYNIAVGNFRFILKQADRYFSNKTGGNANEDFMDENDHSVC